MSGAGFSTMAPLTSWVGYIFAVGACPVHCRMFSSAPGIYPPPPVMISPNVSRHCQMTPGGQNHPQLRITVLVNSS